MYQGSYTFLVLKIQGFLIFSTFFILFKKFSRVYLNLTEMLHILQKKSIFSFKVLLNSLGMTLYQAQFSKVFQAKI